MGKVSLPAKMIARFTVPSGPRAKEGSVPHFASMNT
jgi:hypothetical protein